MQLPVGRQSKALFTLAAPVVDPARCLAEAAYQCKLALFQRPGILGVDLGPPGLDLAGDDAVGRLGRAAVDLKRGGIHV
jgi:hypothetical protein